MEERLSSVYTGRSVGSSGAPMDASPTPGRSVRGVTPGPGVVPANAGVLRIFQITHFDEALAIFPSVALALEGRSDG